MALTLCHFKNSRRTCLTLVIASRCVSVCSWAGRMCVIQKISMEARAGSGWVCMHDFVPHLYSYVFWTIVFVHVRLIMFHMFVHYGLSYCNANVMISWKFIRRETAQWPRKSHVAVFCHPLVVCLYILTLVSSRHSWDWTFRLHWTFSCLMWHACQIWICSSSINEKKKQFAAFSVKIMQQSYLRSLWRKLRFQLGRVHALE